VTALAAPPAAPSTTDLAVPDWPGAAAPAVPDWPTTGAPDGAAAPHVVVHGDCLWRIAADRLQGTTGAPATDGQVARAVDAWWTTNASVIGPDPDLLLPGQVLRSPGSP
jgi:nucleoid-associated protein YgaU